MEFLDLKKIWKFLIKILIYCQKMTGGHLIEFHLTESVDQNFLII